MLGVLGLLLKELLLKGAPFKGPSRAALVKVGAAGSRERGSRAAEQESKAAERWNLDGALLVVLLVYTCIWVPGAPLERLVGGVPV